MLVACVVCLVVLSCAWFDLFLIWVVCCWWFWWFCFVLLGCWGDLWVCIVVCVLIIFGLFTFKALFVCILLLLRLFDYFDCLVGLFGLLVGLGLELVC